MSLTKQYFKYVSQNIFGLLGTSCYILADTYFISQAAGTSGVALLNLCLPIYNFIFAIGSMLGLGAATRYAILRAQGDERSERYFSNALLWAMVFALPSCWWASSAPRCCCGSWAATRRSLPWAWGTPASSCCSRPSSCATTSSRPLSGTTATPRWPWWRPSAEALQRGVRYIFMFPMGLGLPGAALATAVSPVLSIALCSRHFFKKSSTVRLVRQLPSPKLLAQSCQLGVSGFVGEMSSGVTTTVFNLLLLRLAGNVAVAAYGVVANYALVATAVFNGVAQAHSRWSAGATAKTMPPVPASSCCWAAEQRLRWRRHCMQFCSGSPGRSSRSSTVRTRPSWRSMPSAGRASTSSAISSRASISWPPAIWRSGPPRRGFCDVAFPRHRGHRGLLSGAERPLRDERRLGRVPGL